VKVTVDRMSVAAGDDAVPHLLTIDVPPDRPLGEVVVGLVERHYLASIAGGRATWILVTGDRPLAVLAQQWPEPRYLVDPAQPISAFGTPHGVSLLFRYWLQHDPDVVYAELAAGREPPRRRSPTA
jgi:hypothetical protein